MDSANLWAELRKEPFHALVELPMTVLLLIYLVAYVAFVVGVAALFWLIGRGDPEAILPDASFRSCIRLGGSNPRHAISRFN